MKTSGKITILLTLAVLLLATGMGAFTIAPAQASSDGRSSSGSQDMIRSLGSQAMIGESNGQSYTSDVVYKFDRHDRDHGRYCPEHCSSIYRHRCMERCERELSHHGAHHKCREICDVGR
jgi:hypothetical protein